MLDPWLRQQHPKRHFLRTIFWNLLEWRVLRDANGIFFASEEEARLANQFFLQERSPGCVVGYGTQAVMGDSDIQKQAFFLKLPETKRRKIILFLSRIHQKKGLDNLLPAFARYATKFPEFDLVIAGPDEVGLTPQLQGLAVDLGIEKRVHWAGMLTGDVKWGAFRSAEFFVLPSHQENFGIAVVEAMSLSVPVLITKKVNIWREVVNSGSGYVVDDDVNEISLGLQHMCELSHAQLEDMGLKAKACFAERFDLEKNAMEMLKCLNVPRIDAAWDVTTQFDPSGDANLKRH